jgi:hypothetical protein
MMERSLSFLHRDSSDNYLPLFSPISLMTRRKYRVVMFFSFLSDKKKTMRGRDCSVRKQQSQSESIHLLLSKVRTETNCKLGPDHRPKPGPLLI